MSHDVKHIYLLVLLFLGIGLSGAAQENIAPINYNPFVAKNNIQKASSYYKTTALGLPFFEDFTNYSADPDSSKWIGRQVYINNTMGVNMISRGVATFDALNQFGVPYNTTIPTAISYADSLTSKQIDLSSYSSSDSIYLSFFFQPAGNGFAPDGPDSLMLFFKSKTTGAWVNVWSASDTLLHPFKQALIPVSDPKFLHSNFQFRFINKASIGINDDVWNLDYIKLDAGRNKFDTSVNDVAFSSNPSSILNDYTAMPYRQYIAAAGAERAGSFGAILKNNFNIDQTLATAGYDARELATGTALSSDLSTGKLLPSKDTGSINFSTYTATPSAGSYDKIIFENTYYTNPVSGDLNPTNDTIVGQQVFDNYLAYDDGTAEMSYYLNLFPTLPGKIAIEHHLNTDDTLRGMAIYFGRQVPLAGYKYFSIVVYKTIAYGSSIKDDIIYQIDNLQPGYIDTVNHFWIYKFDKAVPIPSGTFYIGTTQPALSGSDSLYIGLDRNRIQSNHAYYNVLNSWSPSLVSGALMMRPILGAPIIGTHIAERITETKPLFELYPNPTEHLLSINVNTPESNLNYMIQSVDGKMLQKGDINLSSGSIDISSLPSGVYLLHLQSRTQIYRLQKFIKK